MNLEEKVTGDPNWFATMMAEQLDNIAKGMYGRQVYGEPGCDDFEDVQNRYGERSHEAQRVQHFATLYVLCVFVKEVLEEVDELNLRSGTFFAPHD